MQNTNLRIPRKNINARLPAVIALPRLPLNAPPREIQGRGCFLPLFLDQTEARRAQKNFFETGPLLSKGLDDRLPPSPYLKAWIRHWNRYLRYV